MTEDYLFEDATEEQPRRAVVMVGRMNPPTRGHYKVMDSMVKFIRENPDLKLDATPVVVIIAGKQTSENTAKNPLTAEERKTYMESSGKANAVKFLISNNAFAAFNEVRKAGFEPIAVAAGSDRVDEYMRILDKHFKTEDDKPIKHYSVPGLGRDQDGEQDDGPAAFDKIAEMINDGDKIDDSQISATLARYLAVKGEEKAFAYVSGLEKKPKLAALLMKKVKDRVGAE